MVSAAGLTRDTTWFLPSQAMKIGSTGRTDFGMSREHGMRAEQQLEKLCVYHKMCVDYIKIKSEKGVETKL